MATPKLDGLTRRIAPIGRDAHPDCLIADQAEMQLHELGEELKFAGLTNWALYRSRR